VNEHRELVERLLHPTLGVTRGIIDFTEAGKGGRDPDDKLTSISFGELREIHSALGQSKAAIETLEAQVKGLREARVAEFCDALNDAGIFSKRDDPAAFVREAIRAVLNGGAS